MDASSVNTPAVAGPSARPFAAGRLLGGSSVPTAVLVPAAVLLWAAAAAITLLVPDSRSYAYTAQLGIITAAVAGLIVVWEVAGLVVAPLGAVLRRVAPWLIVLGLVAAVFQLATAKFQWLPLPYFAAPQAILGVYPDDGSLLLESLGYSVRLLAIGFAIGTLVGFSSGLAMGWSRRVNYWLNPIVRVIGPVPATAWLPLAFVLLPTNFVASIFMIGLATWFPVTMLTWSGVVGVNRAYYDVARTLGARNSFLIWKVAVPAAMPSVFVGLFMGLGASFVTLLVAELLGVKAGLGWYIQWALGWEEYKRVWAALLIMIVLFSGLISLLFRVRNWALSWQKGLIQW